MRQSRVSQFKVRSPPETRRRQLHQSPVGVAEVEARSAARPMVFAGDRDVPLAKPPAPGLVIRCGDRQGEMKAATPVMARDGPPGVDDIVLGGTGLED